MKKILFTFFLILNYIFSKTPEERAQEILSKLNITEKLSYLHGIKGPYVGNVDEIPRLKIPKINLEDGPQGVADGVKNVTLLPSVLTLTASWDRDLVRKYGEVLGKEQRGKGTNVHLGPMVNIARVPWGGRNFEAMGEDPYLASQLVKPYIEGVQSQNVIACVKHWVGNEQENNRNNGSSSIDERSLHEIYYPPFVAAVKANVGSVMCSYNRINGTFACENDRTINYELKGRMGFKYWIMSDWWATHSTIPSFKNGLDQEMPDNQFFGDKLEEELKQGNITEEEINEKVLRILTSMITFGAYDNPTTGDINSQVRMDENTAIARKVAEESMVLLKNEDDILPINTEKNQIKTIVVLGTAAHDKNYAKGGGSGGVDDYYQITPLEGIRARAGNETEIKYLNSSNIGEAIALSMSADLIIVVSGTFTSEGGDRRNLNLDNNDDQLISAVSAINPNIIVIVHNPGHIILPWINKVKACIAAFYPGEQAGNAEASVLFGDVNPSGKLPVTLPKYENQTSVNDKIRYPGIDENPVYSEKLLVGYRWNNKMDIEPEFHFGHGLSYTSFAFSDLHLQIIEGKIEVGFNMKNTGDRYGKEVAQLYLTFPETVNEPPKILKGFEKIGLNPNESVAVKFYLDQTDLSIWNVENDNWELIEGSFGISIGSSVNKIQAEEKFYVNEVDMNIKKDSLKFLIE